MEPLTDPRLRAAIEAVPGWEGRHIGVTPISVGATHDNFLIEADDRAYVLGLAALDTEVLGIDREAEYEAARTAAVAGVGPEVFAWLPNQGCMVTQFVSGAPIPAPDLQREDVLASVVGSVRALHACPPIRSEFDVFRAVEGYRRIASDRGVEIPGAHEDASEVAGRIEAALESSPTPSATCHNDLRPDNVLRQDEHVWIVDYETAGMGDPFLDLGSLAAGDAMDESGRDTLLSLYFGRVADVHRARLALMRLMAQFRDATWGLVQRAVTTVHVDRAGTGDAPFDRLLAEAADPRFGAWLEEAAAPLP